MISTSCHKSAGLDQHSGVEDGATPALLAPSSGNRLFPAMSASSYLLARRHKYSRRRPEDSGPSLLVWSSFQSFQTGLARSFVQLSNTDVLVSCRHEARPNPALETTRQRCLSHLEASMLRWSSCVFQACSQQREARNWMTVQLRLSHLAVQSALREQLTQLACRLILHASVLARVASLKPDGSNNEPGLSSLSVVVVLAIWMCL